MKDEENAEEKEDKWRRRWMRRNAREGQETEEEAGWVKD